MRLSGLAVTLLLGLSGTALAADPATIYSEFANTGRLACTYDRGSLQRVLDDASLYQYSDARTIARLRLMVRGQLAGSCQRAAASSQSSSSSAAPTAGTPGSGGPGAGPDAQTAATGSGSGLPGSEGASSATGGGSASTPPGPSGSIAGGEPGRRPSGLGAQGQPAGLGAQGQPAGPDSLVPAVLSSSEGPGESVWSPLWIGLVVVAAAGIGAAGFVARRTLMQ